MTYFKLILNILVILVKKPIDKNIGTEIQTKIPRKKLWKSKNYTYSTVGRYYTNRTMALILILIKFLRHFASKIAKLVVGKYLSTRNFFNIHCPFWVHNLQFAHAIPYIVTKVVKFFCKADNWVGQNFIETFIGYFTTYRGRGAWQNFKASIFEGYFMDFLWTVVQQWVAHIRVLGHS